MCVSLAPQRSEARLPVSLLPRFFHNIHGPRSPAVVATTTFCSNDPRWNLISKIMDKRRRDNTDEGAVMPPGGVGTRVVELNLRKGSDQTRHTKKPRLSYKEQETQSSVSDDYNTTSKLRHGKSSSLRRDLSSGKPAVRAPPMANVERSASTSVPVPRGRSNVLGTDNITQAQGSSVENQETMAAALLCTMAPTNHHSSPADPENLKELPVAYIRTTETIPRPEKLNQRLQSCEKLAVSMLCSMAPESKQEHNRHDLVPGEEESPGTNLVPEIPSPDQKSFRRRLQTPEKLAISTLCNMAPSNSVWDNDNATDVSSETPPKNKRKRRPRDVTKPTLDSLVRDKFGGNVFDFLSSVEKEMNQSNFTATGLARKYGAVNCQSRFRTIVAELKEEPIVGMSRLWKERVQAYLRSTRGEEGQENNLFDDRLHRVKEVVSKEDADTTDNLGHKIRENKSVGQDAAENSAQFTLSTEKQPPPKTKRRRQLHDKGPKTTLDALVQKKFGGDSFRFLRSVEEQMNKDGFTATGLARQYGAVNCQSRFRTIVAELRGEPIVGMSKLWKERVQAYLKSKESNKTGKESVRESMFTKEAPPRLVHEDAETVGILFPQQFGSDENDLDHNGKLSKRQTN